MNLFIIGVILLLCILITGFLTKDTFASRKTNILFTIITVLISSLFTIWGVKFSSLNNISERKTDIRAQNAPIPKVDEPTGSPYIKMPKDYLDEDNVLADISPKKNAIIFDSLKNSSVNTDLEDIKIINNTDEKSSTFVLSSDFFDIETNNNIKFSFRLNKKYKKFKCYLKVEDYTEQEMTQPTRIIIYTNKKLIFESENIYSISEPLYINLNITNASKLSFSINTYADDIESDFYRIIKFSEITVK